MNPELGLLALSLAFASSLVQGPLALWAAARREPWAQAWVLRASRVQFAGVALAFLALSQAFLTHDFSVRVVAEHSHTTLPWAYRLAAVWGGHEGSVLLWALMLAGWSAAVSVLGSTLPLTLRVRVLGVLGAVTVGLLGFLLFTSNPFDRLSPAPLEGRDLNPLLQDPGMVSHPPILYMGYVGTSVAFAFAVAALLEGRLDAAWARWTRPWTLWAWTFLTLGILLGSRWAYSELGWGGWWFWDAVENASLMPWLVTTALIHSLALTEKRGNLRSWTLLLAILAFGLSLLGTFLVRSGVLSSVHAFASDPRRGVFILAYLAAVLAPALTLYAWRASRLEPGPGFALLSRDGFLLFNNLLLTVAAGTVLLGTLYPLALDAFGLGKISVGPPYFEAVIVPLMIPLLALTALGPRLHWKRDAWQAVWPRVRLGLAAATAVLIAMLAFHPQGLAAALGVGLAGWILAASAGEAWHQLRRGRPTLAFFGMIVAHLGLAVFVLGVTLVRTLETASDHSLRVGEQAELDGRSYTFAELTRVQGANYVAARARFEVREHGQPMATLHPERRLYTAQQSPMTEAAIHRRWQGDLYVSLGEATADGAWIVRVQHKPFIGWIWWGAAAMALGGALAAADRRYRRTQPSPAARGDARDLLTLPL